MFEREPALLGLLSQTAYASILKSFQALLRRKDVRPGCVLSLQTYGAYGANFNPHCHGLVSDGAFTPDGEFLPLPSLDAAAVCPLFRRLLLLRLHRAERLSESFMNNLLSWVHPDSPFMRARRSTLLRSLLWNPKPGIVPGPYWPWMRSKSMMTADWF